MTNQISIDYLAFYPVKSCRAVELQSAFLGPRGLEVGSIRDRSWMVVDANGRLVSQREYPSMARVAVELLTEQARLPKAFRLSAEGMQSIIVEPAAVGDQRETVIIHGDKSPAHTAPAAVSHWFRTYLGADVHVVHQKQSDLRPCDHKMTRAPESDKVGFADGYPYLVTSTRTLADLNAHLAEPVPMTRFRPNIVVNAGNQTEYGWRSLSVGSAALGIVAPCPRCIVTTIDQQTGMKGSKEPLATLARTAVVSEKIGKAHIKGAVFGVDSVPTAFGTIAVGDPVRVTETRRPYAFRQRSTPRL